MRNPLVPAVTGAILCGGQGRRLGGRDKGLVNLAGRPLVSHVLDRLQDQVDAVVLNANRNQDQYSKLGYPVIADETTTFEGPLAGMLAVLEQCRSELLVCVPCDAPVFPRDLVHRLGRVLDARRPIACAHDGERLQPTFVMLHTRVASDLRKFLAGNERKIDKFYSQAGFASVDFSDQATAFANLNRESDFRQFDDSVGKNGAG